MGVIFGNHTPPILYISPEPQAFPRSIRIVINPASKPRRTSQGGISNAQYPSVHNYPIYVYTKETTINHPTYNPSTISTLRRLFPYLKSQWPWLAIGLVSSLSLSLLWMLPPFVVSVLIDKAIPNQDAGLLVRLTLAVLGAGALIIVFGIVESYCLERATNGVTRDVRIALFNAIQSQSYRFFVHNDRGTVNSRVWNDVSEVQWVVRDALVDIASSVLLIAVTLVFMFLWNWELSLLILGFLPLIFGIGFIVSRWRERLAHGVTQWYDENSSFISDRLDIDGSILLNGVGYDKTTDSRRFSEITSKLHSLWAREGMANASMSTVGAVLPLIGSGIIYLYGGLGVMDGSLTLGVLIAFMALWVRTVGPLAFLASFQAEFAAKGVHLRRIFEWVDLEPEVRDSINAEELESVGGHISLKNATVKYDAGSPVISGLSLEFQPGKMTAIVGKSGAGKTTLSHLILRLYDPTTGTVEIDGQDLRSIKLSSLRQHMSLVPQDSAVFNTTVKENLLIARPHGTENEMVNACKAAQLHDLLVSLPNGYETVVGQFGYRLSGGERQRLAIARVILKQPSVVILDEPTSSLDSITERAIKDALESTLLQNATTIVIAHRLSTILNADSVIVLDEGKLVDSGSHEVFLVRCDLYKRLYDEQFAPQTAHSASHSTSQR